MEVSLSEGWGIKTAVAYRQKFTAYKKENSLQEQVLHALV
jgi:hypothetical protein